MPLGSPALTYLFISCLQTMLQLMQSSTLSASCSRLLLQITSSLLLGENITLPKSLIKEMIQKVCPWSLKISFCSCGFVQLTDGNLLFHKVFSSMLGQDLILEFTKEMFTMKEFEQVSRRLRCLFLFPCTSLTAPPRPAALPSHHVALRCQLAPLRRSFIPQLWPECVGQPDPCQSPAPHGWFHGL